jgi:hypothetical protein
MQGGPFGPTDDQSDVDLRAADDLVLVKDQLRRQTQEGLLRDDGDLGIGELQVEVGPDFDDGEVMPVRSVALVANLGDKMIRRLKTKTFFSWLKGPSLMVSWLSRFLKSRLISRD